MPQLLAVKYPHGTPSLLVSDGSFSIFFFRCPTSFGTRGLGVTLISLPYKFPATIKMLYTCTKYYPKGRKKLYINNHN